MRRAQSMIAAAALAVALPLLLPVPAVAAGDARPCAAQGAPAGLRFTEPMLVPGARWSYRVLVDVAEPDRVGETVEGVFSTPEGEEGLIVAFDLPGERQVLSADPFVGAIHTLRISNAPTAIDLAFSPPLVHFRYPFQVGDTWRNDLRFSGVMRGLSMEGEVSSVFQVVAEECIDTEAGPFPALVLENQMTFPSLGQGMLARLWVSGDGLLLRRESWVGDVQTQIIELGAYHVPMAGRLEQLSRELNLLDQEVRAGGPAPFLLSWYVRVAQWESAAAVRAVDRHAQRGHVRRAAQALRAVVALSSARDARDGSGRSRLTRGAATMVAHAGAIEEDLHP